MMRVLSPQHIYVQCDTCMVAEALEKLVQQVDIEVADAGTGIVRMVFQSGATGEINYHA